MAVHLVAQERTARGHFWYRLRARAVAKRLPRGATLIDIGAGAGSLGAILEQSRPDVAYRYAEPDAELLAHLRTRFGEKRHHVSNEPIAPPACVALLDVLEHVSDDAELVRSAIKGLPAGSLVVVTVPAMKWLWSEWDTMLGHVRRYRRPDLRRVLEAAGLRKVTVRYLFPELIPAALVRRYAGKVTSSTEDFPPIPSPLNRLLYGLGLVTQLLGRVAPFGTSVLGIGVTE